MNIIGSSGVSCLKLIRIVYALNNTATVSKINSNNGCIWFVNYNHFETIGEANHCLALGYYLYLDILFLIVGVLSIVSPCESSSC